MPSGVPPPSGDDRGKELAKRHRDETSRGKLELEVLAESSYDPGSTWGRRFPEVLPYPISLT